MSICPLGYWCRNKLSCTSVYHKHNVFISCPKTKKRSSVVYSSRYATFFLRISAAVRCAVVWIHLRWQNKNRQSNWWYYVWNVSYPISRDTAQKKILSSSTLPHLAPNRYDFLSFLKHERSYFLFMILSIQEKSVKTEMDNTVFHCLNKKHLVT